MQSSFHSCLACRTFPNEEPIVKLQVINLAAKLYITNSKQTKLLTQYILNLASKPPCLPGI